MSDPQIHSRQTSSRMESAIRPRPAWWQRLVLAAAARSLGKPPDPMRIKAWAPLAFLADALLEGTFLHSRACPPRLKLLAAQRVSSIVGCPW